ncbi:GTP cyclohydrolase II [Helicobacter cetorum]|uniref:GTP cyclohydrolase II n=1 Tax=Helicobacter cetorum TaxID=138563 RepID=UPI000CF1985A|nr:GTP cyclohydrolase II [Helicobacter cetorum]
MQHLEVSNKAKLPTQFGEFYMQSFREKDSNGTKDHLVIFTPEFSDIPLVRLHSECLTGDALGSQKCDCGGELQMAMERIISSKEGGLVIYLRQEGRGIGLFNKVNAYALQDKGYDTIQANEMMGFKDDERDYSIVGEILEYYRIKKMRLLTNNPKKIMALEKYAEIERESLIICANEHNKKYLEVKKLKMGHLL